MGLLGDAKQLHRVGPLVVADDLRVGHHFGANGDPYVGQDLRGIGSLILLQQRRQFGLKSEAVPDPTRNDVPGRPDDFPMRLDGRGVGLRQPAQSLDGDGVGPRFQLSRLHQLAVEIKYHCTDHRASTSSQ